MTDRQIVKFLINKIWDLGEEGNFEGINSLLEKFPIEKYSLMVNLSLLMNTANYPEITYRPIYRQRLRKWCVDTMSEKIAQEGIDTIE